MSKDELSAALATMNANVAKAGGKMTVGLTIYPPYPKDPTMPEWSYQNGGDWVRKVRQYRGRGVCQLSLAVSTPLHTALRAFSTRVSHVPTRVA